jgi:hypothetical protein
MKNAKKAKKPAKRTTKQNRPTKRPLASLTEGEFNSILDRTLNKNEETGYTRVELNQEVNRRQL